jgi:hypothetical protein
VAVLGLDGRDQIEKRKAVWKETKTLTLYGGRHRKLIFDILIKKKDGNNLFYYIALGHLKGNLRIR